MAVAHNFGLRAQGAVGEDNLEAVAVALVCAVEMQPFGGVVQLLAWRVENALLLVVLGDGVEDDFADGIVVAVFDEARVQLAGIVARIGVDGHLIGVALGAEGARNLDEIGVGAGIEQAVDNGYLLVVGVNVDVGRATGKCSER